MTMRTEDDLRAALTSLEQHAPAAARVLPDFSSRRRSRRGLRSPLALRWVAGIATTAAVAGAVTGLALTSGTSATGPAAVDTPTPGFTTTNGGVTAPVPITKATLQARVLAAFSAVGDEIVFMQGTYQTVGVAHTDSNPATNDTWYYPGQPSVGQQVRVRTTSVQAGFGDTDTGFTFIQPAPQSGQPLGLVQTKGEQIYIDHQSKTWWEGKDEPVMFDPPYNPALIASYFKSTRWTARNTTLNGKPAIELTLKSLVQQGGKTVNSWTEYLWVDAGTYLPLHDVMSFGPPGQGTHAVEDFQYLPATPANLAKLTPSIPAGYKQVAAPKFKIIKPTWIKATPTPGKVTATPPSPSPSPSSK